MRNYELRYFDSAYLTDAEARTLTRDGTNVAASIIHPNLKIKDGEIKVIIECAIFKYTGFDYIDGRLSKNVSPREAFGFWMLSPKPIYVCYFNTVVIFTPKPGLFDDNGPT
jgi:hypothetical protein